MFDISCFLGMNFYGNYSFQNMFVYQPVFRILDLKEGKGTEYIVA